MSILILVVVGAAGTMVGIILAIIFVPLSPPRGGRKVRQSVGRRHGWGASQASSPGGSQNPPAVSAYTTQEVT